MTRRADAVTVLSLYLVLLAAIPSRLTFAPLGGAGSPARIMGLACMAWWMYRHFQGQGSTTRQPVRAAFFALVLAVLVSYVAASSRPMTSDESMASILALVLIASFGGTLLVGCDGIPSMERLVVLLRRVVLAGAAMATLACLQFLTGQAFVDKLSIPGLTSNVPIMGLATRSGLNRPSATAIHPIELGMVLTMILPIACNVAIADTSRSLVRRFYPPAAILLASVLCISRSAIIGLVIGLAVVTVRWPSAARRLALVIGPFFVLALFVLSPSLVSTLSELFTGAGDDSSVQSRTDSYALAGEFIHRSPLIGRGLGTFLPQYRILDNQYLGLMIEIGLIGVACFLALVIVGINSAGAIRKAAPDWQTTQLAQGITASITVGAVCLAFFDALSFPIASGLLFLLIGIAGAGHRLMRERAHAVTYQRPVLAPLPLPTEGLTRSALRRFYLTAVGIALTALAVVHVLHTPGVYWSQTEVMLLAPKSAQNPNSISSTSGGVLATAGLVALDVSKVLNQPVTASAGTHLPGTGVRDGESVRVPDSGGQWAHDFERPVVAIEVVGPDAAEVNRRAKALTEEVTADLGRRQREDGTYPKDWITADPSPDTPQVFYLNGQLKRAAGVVLLLGVWGTLLLVSYGDGALRLLFGLRPQLLRRTASTA